MKPPSDEWLDQFMRGFYGYGDPAARWWFVGQEEGGAGSISELSAHLHAWRDRGCQELEDLAELQTSKGVTKYFGASPTFHPYWGRLARVLTCARGESPDSGRIMEVQGTELGRAGSGTCLVELLPLPKPTRDSWEYARFSRLRQLQDADRYMAEVAVGRAQALRQRILDASPAAVFFCSTGADFMPYWEMIAGGPLVRRKLMARRYIAMRKEGTVYLAMQNPSGAHPPHEYLEQIGALVAARAN